MPPVLSSDGEPDSTRLDVLVFGATSFVGAILCRELVKTFGLGGEQLRWGMAGRSIEKLSQLRASLGPGACSVPLLVADAADAASLRELCSASRVIITTVGPYALHGEPLVQACVETGTDYCDLSGEVQWIRRMIERYETAAQASGARIVHCCGFDSIPSDLGVHFLQREAERRFGAPCESISMRVRAMRGGFSGGTVASLLNVVKEAAADPALRRELLDPYSLCPREHRNTARQRVIRGAHFDPAFAAWTAPFVMGPVNTRVVLRSHALGRGSDGQALRYDEAVLTGRGLRGRLTAMLSATGLNAFMLSAAVPPLRALLERFVLPAPGEGPSPEAQISGFFDLRFRGVTAQRETLQVRVTGDRDPGYGSTARMLAQAGACLSLDLAAKSSGGGFWTPATLLGDLLIDRLQRNAGLTFTVLNGSGRDTPR